MIAAVLDLAADDWRDAPLGLVRGMCEQRRGEGWREYDTPCLLDGCSCWRDERVLAAYAARLRGLGIYGPSLSVGFVFTDGDIQTMRLWMSDRFALWQEAASAPYRIEVREHAA